MWNDFIPQVGHLAMETLLSLTSKRAGEWFKEELRNLGGVDHIVRTIHDCAGRLESPVASWTELDIDVLRKADRCMRVLENVSIIGKLASACGFAPVVPR